MTNREIRKFFQNIRVWRQKDKRAPHKPLLLLLAISRAMRGETNLTEFREIDAPLKLLLQKFGPSTGPASRHHPFWHLRTDFDGALWQLDGPEGILNRQPGSTPTLSELRDPRVRAGLAPDVRPQLQNDKRLTAEVIGILLYKHFPTTLHEDILAEVGLPLRHVLPPLEEIDEEEYRRDSRFREWVLDAYNHRCCVCNHDLRIADRLVGLEAAHIKWVQVRGPHEISNGLSLCSIHHKMFDYGVFTVEPKNLSIIISKQATTNSDSGKKLLSYHGAGIILPSTHCERPDPTYLNWHRNEVFKSPGRDKQT